MRRWLAAPLLLAAAVTLALDGPPAAAQPAKAVEESFNTADGVRLKGLFHRSPNSDKQGGAVVVLLYPPGPGRTMLKGDWDGLIAKLNDAGFHVFRFDWRGHGASTDIVDLTGDNNPFNGFLTNVVTGPWNQKLKGYNKKPTPNAIKVADNISAGKEQPAYFPVYVNDLAAVRYHLDLKNDQSEVNTGSIYLVGAGDAATLGMMWLAAEWKRPATAPMLPAGQQYKVVPMRGIEVDPPAGYDVAGAVWLTANRPAVVHESTVQAWATSAVKLRDNNKMLFLFGAEDKAGQKEAAAFFDKVLVAGGSKTGVKVQPVEQTFQFPVPKTKLSGLALLGKDNDTKVETKTLEYLMARQKDRVNMVRKNRGYTSPYYIDVNYFANMR